MRHLIRSTAWLALGSLISVLFGFLAAKVYAVVLGPRDFGILGITQTLTTFLSIITGLGVSAALINYGSHALEKGELQRMQFLRNAASHLLWISGIVGTLLLILAAVPLAQVFYGSASAWPYIISAAVAGLFAIRTGYNLGVINAHRKVRVLALSTAISSVCGALSSIALISTLGRSGIVWVVVVAAMVAFLVSWAIRRRFCPRISSTSPQSQSAVFTRDILKFGLPQMAGLMVGGGTLALLPILLRTNLSEEAVGYYRAVLTISVGGLGFLLNAFSQDYYPKLSASREDKSSLYSLIRQQQALVLTLGTPFVALAIALSDVLIHLVYAPTFQPAVEILRWYMMGEVFKLLSWTLSIAVLVCAGATVFFWGELGAGLIILLANYVSTRLLGNVGIGVAYLATYVLYCGLQVFLLHWTNGYVMDRKIIWVTLGIVGMLGSLLWLTYVGWSLIAAILSGLVALFSSLRLWNWFKSKEEKLPLMPPSPSSQG